MYKKDKMMVCPYDKHHVIRAQRYIRHILRCEKNNPDKKIFFCFYQNVHVFRTQTELIQHELMCPARENFDLAALRDPGSLKPLENSTFSSNFQTEENWCCPFNFFEIFFKK